MYAPLVVRWCYGRGLAATDAEDVSQEVFLRVSERLDQFRKEKPTDTFRGWLCRITHNEIANHFRRLERLKTPEGGTVAHVRTQTNFAPQNSNIDFDLSADDDGEENVRAAAFLYHEAVTRVRCEFEDKTWQMFWRTAVDGNTAIAIAIELGVTPAAVRKAKSRILRRLKQEVGDLDG